MPGTFADVDVAGVGGRVKMREEEVADGVFGRVVGTCSLVLNAG